MPAKFSALDGWFDVFRAGTHTDMRGSKNSFDAATLDGIVSNYADQDPVPVVVGHPEDDAPAYGWVDRIRRVGDRLQARLRDIAPAFREAVEEGRYAGRSVALLKGQDGTFSLRHIGFLGGAAPAVSGLAPTRFAAPASFATYEFASSEGVLRDGIRRIAAVLRSVREWIIDSNDLETADRIVPAWQLEGIEPSAREDGHDDVSGDATTNFSERVDLPEGGPAAPATDTNNITDTNKEAEMPEDDKTPAGGREDSPSSAALKERTAELDAREKGLAEKETAFAERERTAAAEAEIEKAISDGRLLPREKAGAVAFLTSLGDGDGATTLSFAGADAGRIETSPREWFLEFVGGLNKRVDYAERSNPARTPSEDGALADDRLANERVAARARAYMKTARERDETVTYAAAVDAVRANADTNTREA